MPQFGLGVRFMDLAPDDQAEIEQLVRQNA